MYYLIKSVSNCTYLVKVDTVSLESCGSTMFSGRFMVLEYSSPGVEGDKLDLARFSDTHKDPYPVGGFLLGGFVNEVRYLGNEYDLMDLMLGDRERFTNELKDALASIVAGKK